MTTTMNAKLNVLEQMMDTVAAPRTKSTGESHLHRQPKVLVRIRRSTRTVPKPAPAESLWRVTMAEARDVVAERALTWALMGVALASLGWLAYTTMQFFLAWQGLVTWVRAAMV